MLHVSLLYNEVNQLYVYIYPLPLGPPCHPFRSSQSTQLSFLCCIYSSFPLAIYFTHGSVYLSFPVSQFFPPSLSRRNKMSVHMRKYIFLSIYIGLPS